MSVHVPLCVHTSVHGARMCINIFDPLIARIFVGHSMSSTFRKVGSEWIRVCGKLAHTHSSLLYYHWYNYNIDYYCSSFPMEWLITDQKRQKV